MKKLLALILILSPLTAFAALPPTTAPQGGTGWNGISQSALLYGLGASNLRLATTSAGVGGEILAFLNGIPTWTASSTLSTISGLLNLANQVTGVLPVANGGTASSTPLGGILVGNGISAIKSLVIGTNLTFDGTTLNATSGGSGSGTVSTSSAETAGRVPFWESTAGTPALLSGGVAGFTFDSTLSKLTVTNASSSNLTVSGLTAGLALTSSVGTFSTYAGSNCGANTFANTISALGALGCIAVDLANAVSGILPVANGGTGWANIFAGAIPYGNGTTRLSTTTAGTNGQVLALVSDIPTWVATTTAGTGLTYDGTSFNNAGVLSNVAGSGITVSGATGNVTISTNDRDDIATTTDIAISQLAYITKTGGLTTIGSVATGTISSANSALTVTSGRSCVGGSCVFTVSTTTNTMFTGTPGQVLGYTNLGWGGVATTTAGTGLTYTGSAFNVNTSQNIATLSNLTGNGIVFTSGGVGTLNTANFSANTIPYVNGAGTGIAYTATSTLNLASLTATDSTLTFSGAFNGNVARTVGLNLANANTWSVLQTFGNASSTLFSSVYASSTRAFFGTLNLVNLADGCLNITSGVVGSTGSACGSGGGGVSDEKWATSTVNSLAIYPNSATSVGIGSTTPWGKLSVAFSNMVEADYLKPLFAVATSTDTDGQLFSVFATTTSYTSLFDTGTRTVVGFSNRIFSSANLFINGMFSSSWQNSFCDNFTIGGTFSSDTSTCGFLFFDEGSTATLAGLSNIDPLGAGGAYGASTLSVTSATVSDGAALTTAFGRGEYIASTTPKMEVLVGRLQNVSTTTGFYIGFLSTTVGAASNNPSNGCYFAATTTPQWRAVCQSVSNHVVMPTGISTSTTANYMAKFKVETGDSVARFYVAESEFAPYVKVAEISGNSVPTSNAFVAGVLVRRIVGGTAIAPSIIISSFRYWQRIPFYQFDL